MTSARRLLALLAVLSLGALAAAPGAGATGLTTGFASDPLLVADTPATMSYWNGQAAAAGAGAVRMNIVWKSVAPAVPPTGFVASDPSSPGYYWPVIDQAVRAIAAHHLNIIATILWAPSWAQGPGRPAAVYDGSWRPNPAAFAAFATAAARRYSGHFPDPLRPGATLPRISMWQAWNEPNLEYYLAPAWNPDGTPASPGIYRQLLNAFYSAVKAVNSRNTVIMAGTAPYGDVFNCPCDAPGGARIRPLVFYRSLFCLTTRLTATSCPSPTYLDGIDHHPYQLLQPQLAPFYFDDVAIPNMGQIVRVLHAAVKVHHVLPNAPKRVLATEITWDSNPPSTAPGAAPPLEQACYYELSMYLLWRQGVDTVMLLQIRDRTSAFGFAQSFQWGGIFFYDGTPKPSFTAFRFPLVARRLDRRHIQVWGRAPSGGVLTLSRQLANHRWVTAAHLRVSAGQVFLVTLKGRGPLAVSGRVGANSSLPWTWGSAACPGHGRV